MDYSQHSQGKVDISETYKEAIAAASLIDQAMNKVGPGTECFGHLSLAAAECRNWISYLGNGGYPRFGDYQPMYPWKG